MGKERVNLSDPQSRMLPRFFQMLGFVFRRLGLSVGSRAEERNRMVRDVRISFLGFGVFGFWKRGIVVQEDERVGGVGDIGFRGGFFYSVLLD